MTPVLRSSLEKEGTLLCLWLNRPKANIIDAEMIAALNEALDKHANQQDLKAVIIAAEGPHFSFGASVEEHLPESCEAMLKSLHALVRCMLEYPVAILVAIQGQCLGGGLEVAMAGHRLIAKPDANLGQPEMKLGVFAPAASCLMPERIGQPAAEDLLYSGGSINGEEAMAIGLVDAVNADPEAAAHEYFDAHLAPKSASSLRMAVKAVRTGYNKRVIARLQEVEDLYLEQLMSTRDAVEGLQAFIAKRPAKWVNR